MDLGVYELLARMASAVSCPLVPRYLELSERSPSPTLLPSLNGTLQRPSGEAGRTGGSNRISIQPAGGLTCQPGQLGQVSQITCCWSAAE